MSIKQNIPDFGQLTRVKVIAAVQSQAGPTAAQLMAEWGANVIWLESAMGVDIGRVNFHAEFMNRNKRAIALDVPTPEGKKVFFDLIRESDIFLESSKGGQWARWGITDELLHEANPQLVICHLSGYGQTGDSSFVPRPAYDPVLQAFTGLMDANGFEDRPGIAINPTMLDQLTGAFTAAAILAALVRQRDTGKGEVIDMAEFEIATYFTSTVHERHLNFGTKWIREGNKSKNFCGYGSYECGDGEYIYMLMFGGGIFPKSLKLLDLADDPDFAGYPTGVPCGSPVEQKFEAAIDRFFKSRTASQIEEILIEAEIPCSRVMTTKDLVDHPHFVAREVFTEWRNPEGEIYKSVAPVPKFKNRPSRIWKGQTTLIGGDGEEILKEIGYSDERIAELFDGKVIKIGPELPKRYKLPK